MFQHLSESRTIDWISVFAVTVFTFSSAAAARDVSYLNLRYGKVLSVDLTSKVVQYDGEAQPYEDCSTGEYLCARLSGQWTIAVPVTVWKSQTKWAGVKWTLAGVTFCIQDKYVSNARPRNDEFVLVSYSASEDYACASSSGRFLMSKSRGLLEFADRDASDSGHFLLLSKKGIFGSK